MNEQPLDTCSVLDIWVMSLQRLKFSSSSPGPEAAELEAVFDGVSV